MLGGFLAHGQSPSFSMFLEGIMAKQEEVTRRDFLKEGAIAGTSLAAFRGISFITDPMRVFGANDRIRFGLIGCGDRGQENLHAPLACTNVECAPSQTSIRAASTKYRASSRRLKLTGTFAECWMTRRLTP